MSSWIPTMKSPTQSARPVFCRIASLAATALLIAGCATTEQRAPVEDRKPVIKPAAAVPAPSSTPAPAPVVAEPAATKPVLAGSENAGKPGYYTVKPGDTLIRIALDNGHNWRDVARWSGLDNPNIIEVGQVLRVVPPQADGGVASTRPVAAAGKVDAKPLDGRVDLRNDARNDPRTVSAANGAVPAPNTAATPGAASAAGASTAAGPATVSAAAPAAAPVAAARESDEDINWAWPAAGPVATGFDDAKSKGLAFTGKAGDAVLAAADGRVVYAGSGLRGYGNLVIVKHNATYLTAYAHNQTLLVKEDQAVRRGQKIAEMGATDADRVQLHFEIRRQGKPIDPARLLPVR
jgi:lipoprotein NlpD